jgi:hypothetical protein
MELFRQYSMIFPKTLLPWWDGEKRKMVFPVETKFDPERAERSVENLEKILVAPLSRIAMPLFFTTAYFVGTVPETLRVEQDEESPEIFYVKDEDDRTRIRVCVSSVMPGTVVFTRYWPHDVMADGDLVPCVYDLEKIDEHDDEAGVIFKDGRSREERAQDGGFLTNESSACIKWLRENYPNWKDPLAYWSKKNVAHSVGD